MFRNPAAGWGGSLLFLCAALAAQEPPLIRVTTRLVQVHVAVVDRQGQPVSDLSRDEFIITEEGRLQPIASFSLETSRILKAPVEPLPPDVFTNRYELKGGAPSSVTVVLLDVTNTAMRDKAYARREVLKFLREQLRPDDRVALYVLGGELYLVYDFTADAEQLIQAMKRFQVPAGPSLDTFEVRNPQTGNAELDKRLMKMDQILYDIHAASRVRQTASALEALAARVAALPGRKTLVWVTGGIPFSLGVHPTFDEPGKPGKGRTVQVFDKEIERMARALDAANVALYPVDARGLSAFSAFRGDDKGESVYTTRETMQVLAERTGGKAFLDRNDLSTAIRTAMAETRVTYLLTYRPDHDRWDGQFQRIKVTVTRPGLTVRHRGGYFAQANTVETAQSREEGLLRVVASPLEATAVRMVVAVKPIPARKRLGVRILIEPEDVVLRERGGRWIGDVDLAYIQQAADGRRLKAITDAVAFNLTPAEYSHARQNGVIVQTELDLEAETTKVRVVARDATSGMAGTVEIPAGGQ